MENRMHMNCPDVTLRCIKSHLYHVVFVSTCNVFIHFMFVFYHCTAYTVYFHCLHVRLLRVTLNIHPSINQVCCGPVHTTSVDGFTAGQHRCEPTQSFRSLRSRTSSFHLQNRGWPLMTHSTDCLSGPPTFSDASADCYSVIENRLRFVYNNALS